MSADPSAKAFAKAEASAKAEMAQMFKRFHGERGEIYVNPDRVATNT